MVSQLQLGLRTHTAGRRKEDGRRKYFPNFYTARRPHAAQHGGGDNVAQLPGRDAHRRPGLFSPAAGVRGVAPERGEATLPVVVDEQQPEEFGAAPSTSLAKISYFDIPGGDGDDFQFQNGRKESSSDEEAIMVHHMKMNCRDLRTHKLRWIGEKSGLVVFTMGDGGGAHALNLQEGTVEKLAEEGHSWGNAVGFEMDWAAYLSSISIPSTSDSKC
ncbi:hypothetical protein SEVIR_5G016500v4 [Setaria viridis]|uniref:Uncharacterized protein n=1 Tax=Setaria viridis TaxID=4556 RepID=A0A4V6D5X2_SETVI|nr:hypothetical protein SEVIR_5G016500v2 [Setaria viridis]